MQVNKGHIWQYLQTIRIHFENAYKTANDDEKMILINSWYEILKGYPKEVCDKAVLNALKSSEFAPKIATIVKEIEKMQLAVDKSDSELWAELIKVLPQVSRNVSSYRYTDMDYNGKIPCEEAFADNKRILDSLSPELKEYVRNVQGLGTLSRYTDEELTYERGRFFRIIPDIRERAKTRGQMTGEIAALVQGLANQFTRIDHIDIKRLE